MYFPELGGFKVCQSSSQSTVWWKITSQFIDTFFYLKYLGFIGWKASTAVLTLHATNLCSSSDLHILLWALPGVIPKHDQGSGMCQTVVHMADSGAHWSLCCFNCGAHTCAHQGLHFYLGHGNYIVCVPGVPTVLTSCSLWAELLGKGSHFSSWFFLAFAFHFVLSLAQKWLWCG